MPPQEPVDLCITVDVEFSIGGAFTFPDLYSPIAQPFVECMVGNRDHGLGFLLETMERFGLKGTFFVEVLNTACFGDEPMRSYVERIAAAGHDIGLHLHPCWLAFEQPDWKQILMSKRPVDSLCDRDLSEVEDIMRRGIAILERWGVRPSVLRTGGMHVDLGVYRGQSLVDLPLASNVGLGIWQPKERSLQLMGGHQKIGDVVEVPVTSYLDKFPLRWNQPRCLTTSATSFREMVHLVRQARKKKVTPLVLLTHPFEFVGRSGFRMENLAPNYATQRRFERLCEFVHDNPDLIRAVRFSDRAEAWHDVEEDLTGVTFETTMALAVTRTFANNIREAFWKLRGAFVQRKNRMIRNATTFLFHLFAIAQYGLFPPTDTELAARPPAMIVAPSGVERLHSILVPGKGTVLSPNAAKDAVEIGLFEG